MIRLLKKLRCWLGGHRYWERYEHGYVVYNSCLWCGHDPIARYLSDYNKMRDAKALEANRIWQRWHK